MPSPRLIPSEQPKSVAVYTLLSNGSALPRSYHVLSITVTREINRIPSATLVFVDGDPARQTFAISDTTDLTPGVELEVKLGYRADEQTVFKGIVVKHGIKVRKGGTVLVVECRDKVASMTLATRSQYFHDVTDSDVIEALIGDHSLQSDVASTSLKHTQIVQFNTTDWDMAICRAEANGLMAIVKDGSLSIQPPSFASEPVLTIQYGATVHELDAEVDARLQCQSVQAVSWDAANMELSDSIVGTEPNPPEAGNLSASDLADCVGDSAFQVVHGGHLSTSELQAWVDAALLKYRLSKVRGRVTIDGTAVVEPGSLIQLDGVGQRFQGKLYVTGVRHTLQEGDWRTSIQFGLNPIWFSESFTLPRPAAGGLLPPINGLHIGIVHKLEGDPDGQERIQVRIPVIHKDDEGAWCRLCTLDAGNARGTYFRPEIDDEVVVGFLDSDPRHGLILGMLHSAQHPPPEPLSDDNHKKGYQSREKLRLEFDDEDKLMRLQTPGGNKLTISDKDERIELEDQHGNKLTLDAAGIALQSAKDLKLKAQSNVEVEAVQIELEGSAGTKLTGAGAELGLQSVANLKGTIVNIN